MDISKLPSPVGQDIAVPTITIDGKHDPFTPAGNGSACRAKFTAEQVTTPYWLSVWAASPRTWLSAVPACPGRGW